LKDQQFAKLVVFVNSLVPLAILMWDLSAGNLGADPYTAALHATGNWAIIFLLLSLTVTPLRKLTKKNYFSLFRKMLGLYAFFYACLHLMIYLTFNLQFDFTALLKDLQKNKFVIIGMTALVLMVPLAITSTNGMIKRLGSARWKRLHQLVYVAAIAGVTHFWMSQKKDVTKPEIAVVILVLLLGYRLINRKPSSPKRNLPAANAGAIKHLV